MRVWLMMTSPWVWLWEWELSDREQRTLDMGRSKPKQIMLTSERMITHKHTHRNMHTCGLIHMWIIRVKHPLDTIPHTYFHHSLPCGGWSVWTSSLTLPNSGFQWVWPGENGGETKDRGFIPLPHLFLEGLSRRLQLLMEAICPVYSSTLPPGFWNASPCHCAFQPSGGKGFMQSSWSFRVHSLITAHTPSNSSFI